MQSFPEIITDPVYHQPLKYNWYQRFWLKHINDKRDLPFIKLLTTIHLTIIPAAIVLYTPLLQGIWWWMAAFIYFYFSQFYFKGPFGLMLHCLSHRKTFKIHLKLITKYINWFVCPFFGHLGDGYFSHHVGMHHIEDNMPDDASSTMKYQRDSLKDFLKYWIRFMLTGVRDTFFYLLNKKRRKLYMQLTYNEIFFWVIAAAVCFVNLKATLMIFIIPVLFARLVMMIGNWTQHAFVDPDEPGNDLASTITCVNTIYNHKCWNDGYHTMHHIRPGAHYTEYPLIFRENISRIVTNKTLVFENIHYLHIFFYLIRKRYDRLVANLVNINHTFQDDADAIALMKSRTKKFNQPKLNALRNAGHSTISNNR
ncbi:MAG TPA: fatty acid desaturase [Chitinophagaceae bacterium]|nr:fatty acid desaturase [Chitinophagaceae bacterium]